MQKIENTFMTQFCRQNPKKKNKKLICHCSFWCLIHRLCSSLMSPHLKYFFSVNFDFWLEVVLHVQACHTKAEYEEYGASICRTNPVFKGMYWFKKTILADLDFVIEMLNGMPRHFHFLYAAQFTPWTPSSSLAFMLSLGWWGGGVKYI